jgi:hypothetical protein
MHIQPYELFGLTHKTTLTEVRRAYYDLALLCHPDKGGDAGDMKTINAAYLWIKKGLNECDAKTKVNTTVEYQDLLKEYVWDPSFIEINGESLGFPRSDFLYTDDFMYTIIITKWQSESEDVRTGTTIQQYATDYMEKYRRDTTSTHMHMHIHASIPHGYDVIIMQTSSNEAVQPFDKPLDIIDYQEPMCHDLRHCVDPVPLDLPLKLEDYTHTGMADYEHAFSAIKGCEEWKLSESKLI